MKTYKVGDTVSWKWGKSSASGTVDSISKQKTTIQSKGEQITRNGSNDDPAIVIKQEDGTKVIKLASEFE